MKPPILQTVVLALLFVLPSASFSQYSGYANLILQNPQGWQQEAVNFSEVTMVVRPKGIYTEVGLYLTITDDTGNWDSSTQLEAILNFGLPADAIVNDSWLWIDDIVVQADIIDRWTASDIYEAIVDRRQDPSILFKNSETDYQLRIYPLFGTQSRKVKINLLLPNTWTEEQVLLQLPYYLFQNGNGPIPPLTIRVVSDSVWKAPRFENSNFSFVEAENEVLGKFYESTLPAANTDAPLIRFDSPMREGVYLKTFEEKNNHYYELVLLPSQLFAAQDIPPRKLMVLVHYDPANTSMSLETLLTKINQQLKQHLRPIDEFNLMFSYVSPSPLASEWIPAEDAQIDSLFQTIPLEAISSFFLPELLIKGTEWVVDHSDNGKIFLFANSNRENELDLANQLIKELRSITEDQNVPFYISDYQADNWVDTYFGGAHYQGNEYLYSNLTKISNGASQSLIDGFFEENNNVLFADLSSMVGTMDLYTSLQDGFCFNRFNLDKQTELTNFNTPIRQVGRYLGNFPFVVEIAGELEEQVFFDGVSIPEVAIETGDIETQLAWSGERIKKLEQETNTAGYYPDNRLIYDIIEESIQRRILSLYTAFLALEPSQGGVPCDACLDESESILVATAEAQLDSLFNVEILPNPFRERVHINVQFKTEQRAADFQFAVYNTMGQLVRSFEPDMANARHHIQLQWDGQNQSGQSLGSGMYLFTISSPRGRQSWRLVKY